MARQPTAPPPSGASGDDANDPNHPRFALPGMGEDWMISDILHALVETGRRRAHARHAKAGGGSMPAQAQAQPEAQMGEQPQAPPPSRLKSRKRTK